MHHARNLIGAALVVMAGCSGDSRPPVSPTAILPGVEDAAPDGSTLKVTAPDPVTPADGAVVETETPTLTITAARAKFEGVDISGIRNRFHVLTESGGSVGDAVVNGTTWTIPWELDYETTYRWRVRAEADGAFSAWSRTVSFRTPEDPGGLPRGPYPTNGPAVAAWASRLWPELLRGGISFEERTRNMEFLRDRMIEAGRCGGLDLAWNLKRGVGPHSHDALAWRVGGKVEVIDLARAFKVTENAMSLHWSVAPGPSGYDRYTNKFRCRP